MADINELKSAKNQQLGTGQTVFMNTGVGSLMAGPGSRKED